MYWQRVARFVRGLEIPERCRCACKIGPGIIRLRSTADTAERLGQIVTNPDYRRFS